MKDRHNQACCPEEDGCRCRRKSFRTESYDTADINSKLIINLRNLGHSIRFLSGGKGSQKRILTLLEENGTMTQRTLTERMRIQPGSASEIIGKMETAGLLRRTANERDRRTANIELTEEGKAQAREEAVLKHARHQEMLSCLTPEEKETLLSLLEKVNDHWDANPL